LSRTRPGLDVAVVFALLIAVTWRAGEWLPIPEYAAAALDTTLAVLAAAIVLVGWWRAGVGPNALGLAPSQWRSGWGSLTAFTTAGVVVPVAIGAALGSASDPFERIAWLLDYLPGIAAQQLLMQGFFAPRIENLAAPVPAHHRRAATIFAATAAFVALHAPNPVLMAGVAIAGAFWIWHFLVHRNLLAVLVSHLVLGATAMAALGPGPMLNLRVGPGALELLLR
jgi:predicted NBD/HSP70 family sugar kinase